MKKILFVVPHMLCGGVEKALLALINEMPNDNYDITILMVKSEGEFIDTIPQNIKRSEIFLNHKIRDELMLGGVKASLKYHLKKLHFRKFFKVAFNVLNKDPLATLTIDFKEVEPIEEKYDIAICFHIHMPFIVKYVSEKVDAGKKFAWIHNDFKMSNYNVQRLAGDLNNFEHFFAVSEQLKEEFIELLPQFEKNTLVAHNIISENYIKNLLNARVVSEYPNDDTIKILTIGRLDKQKGYDMAINVCASLKEAGYKFKWFALGSGVEKENIKKQIKDLNLEDTFILLGIRNNPYPYIDQCDIYVQPSRHEGFGIAVAEARVLCKPIVCTNFTGARDQLVDGVTGCITDFELNKLKFNISELIINPKKRNYYTENLNSNQADTVGEVKKLLEFF